MAHSVVDFNMHIPGNALLFAFLFGMLGNPGTNRPDRVPSRSILLRGGLAVLGIAMLSALSSRYTGEAWTEQARIALRNNDYPGCLAQSARGIQADPSNFYPYFYQGEANRITGLKLHVPALREVFFERAIASFRKGLEIFPQEQSTLLRLAQALDGARQEEKAEAAYLDAIRWDPNLGLLYAYYAAHLELTDQPEAAKKCRETAARLGTENAYSLGKTEVCSILAADPALSVQK